MLDLKIELDCLQEDTLESHDLLSRIVPELLKLAVCEELLRRSDDLFALLGCFLNL